MHWMGNFIELYKKKNHFDIGLFFFLIDMLLLLCPTYNFSKSPGDLSS